MMSQRRSMLGLTAAVMLVACGTPSQVTSEEVIPPAPLPEPVYTVDAVDLAILEKFPVALQIRAKGTARTGGWGGAYLRRADSTEPGVLTYYFLAIRPTGPATMALMPIEAAPFTVDPLPDDAKRVKILAETNQMTVDIQR
jgi:hypothetical protein